MSLQAGEGRRGDRLGRFANLAGRSAKAARETAEMTFEATHHPPWDVLWRLAPCVQGVQLPLIALLER